MFFRPTVHQSVLTDQSGHDHLVDGAESSLCLSTRSVAAAQVGSCSSSLIFLLSRERLEDTRGTGRLTTGFGGFALTSEVDVEGVSSSPARDNEKNDKNVMFRTPHLPCDLPQHPPVDWGGSCGSAHWLKLELRVTQRSKTRPKASQIKTLKYGEFLVRPFKRHLTTIHGQMVMWVNEDPGLFLLST